MKGFLTRTHTYTADNNWKPVPCPDLLVWGQWMEEADRTVELTVIGRVNISTVFLGMDHNHFGEGPPILFETMVWVDVPEVINHLGLSNHGREWLDGQERYATVDEARTGHASIVAGVKEHLAVGWMPELEDKANADPQP